MDQVRYAIRLRHLAYKTEQAYTGWILRYILFNRKRHPKEMGRAEVDRFLTYLAVERKVSASTQNQALNALVFLHKNVLQKELGDLQAVRARRTRHLPEVLTREEVGRLFQGMSGTYRTMAQLLYGTGMRLMECVGVRNPLDVSPIPALPAFAPLPPDLPRSNVIKGNL